MEEKKDITQDVCNYFALKEAAESYHDAGKDIEAGRYSLRQTNLHSQLASNICFYKKNPEAARKVMSEFFKKASPYRDLFGKNTIFDDSPGFGGKINYEKINLRSHCFIYNDPERDYVKITVESSMDNVNAKVEFILNNGNLSDYEGEPVKISLPLATFRDENDDPDSIPFNRSAEVIIISSGLVPAYWTSGYSHTNKWFCDGITTEEAKKLLRQGNGDHSGGKYQYIVYDLKDECVERDFNTILESIKRLF